ncbi:MAG: hypothetical protein LC131_02330 [Anaerolineae bacterium]|nr:hypothetical protein [Anaerolineae bacterium]
MSFSFNDPPVTAIDRLRVNIGDVNYEDGQAPDRQNLSDETLGYFLNTASDLNGATALAFDHLATLWIPRPIFGPGELATYHDRQVAYFRRMADEYRSKSADAEVSGGVVTVGSFKKVDGFSRVRRHGEYS